MMAGESTMAAKAPREKNLFIGAAVGEYILLNAFSFLLDLFYSHRIKYTAIIFSRALANTTNYLINFPHPTTILLFFSELNCT